MSAIATSGISMGASVKPMALFDEVDAGKLVLGLVAIASTLWALVQKFGSREIKRFDDAIEEIGELHKTYVTKEELEDVLARIEVVQTMRHEERTDVLERIVSKLDDIEQRDIQNREKTAEKLAAAASQITIAAARITVVEELASFIEEQLQKRIALIEEQLPKRRR